MRKAGGDARSALEHARALLADGNGRGSAPRGPSRRRRRAQAPAPLRPGRRSALRHRLRVHQVDARQRPRRRRLLPRRDARGRRGRPLHRPPDGDPRLRGHRQRRPAGAPRRRRGGAGARARRPARGAAEPLAGCDLPRERAEVERLGEGDLGGARRGARARDPAASAGAPGRALRGRSNAGPRRGIRLAPRRPGRRRHPPTSPADSRGRTYYVPSGNGEETGDGSRDG